MRTKWIELVTILRLNHQRKTDWKTSHI